MGYALEANWSFLASILVHWFPSILVFLPSMKFGGVFLHRLLRTGFGYHLGILIMVKRSSLRKNLIGRVKEEEM